MSAQPTSWNSAGAQDPKERQCTAKAKSTGKRCTRTAIRGGTVCPVHGGGSKKVKNAASRRHALQTAQADAVATLAHLGLDPIADPIDELGRVAREVLAMKDALASRVNALQTITDVNAFGAENVSVIVDLYNAALDRSIRVLDALGKHDLEARKVQIDARTAAMFQWIIAGVLTDLRLPAERQTEAYELVNVWVERSLGGVEAHELPAL